MFIKTHEGDFVNLAHVLEIRVEPLMDPPQHVGSLMRGKGIKIGSSIVAVIGVGENTFVRALWQGESDEEALRLLAVLGHGLGVLDPLKPTDK